MQNLVRLTIVTVIPLSLTPGLYIQAESQFSNFLYEYPRDIKTLFENIIERSRGVRFMKKQGGGKSHDTVLSTDKIIHK